MSGTLTETEGRYVKLIYRRQVEGGKKVQTTRVADAFKVQPATVTETLQKLAQKNIVKYEPYRGVELTEKGLLEAKRLVRNHRLLELLLVNFLNYSAIEACMEASRFDHCVSKDLANRICRAYEHPDFCPCNKLIPRDRECIQAQPTE